MGTSKDKSQGGKKMITRENITNDLKKVCKKLNRVPKKREYDETGTYCSRTVKRVYGSWNEALKEIFNYQHRRSSEDVQEAECKNCKKTTKNPKFCSRSCSTSYNSRSENGRKIGRAIVITFCKICTLELPPNSGSKTKCKDCSNKIKTNTGEYIDRDDATKGMILTDDTQKYRRIRDWARKIAKKSGKLKKCSICEYSNHVECAHIKPIKSFNDNEKVVNINRKENLIGLCPNHHWEFDHELLDLKEK